MSLAMHVREDVVSDRAMRYIDTPRLNLIGPMHAGWYTRYFGPVSNRPHLSRRVAGTS
jgi:hypothetical protein